MHGEMISLWLCYRTDYCCSGCSIGCCALKNNDIGILNHISFPWNLLIGICSLLQPVQLSGSAAVKAKNVVLCVVDQHTLPANNGVVQLFNVPHPKRFSPSPYMSLEAPDIERSQIDVGSSVTITTQEESAPRSEQDMAVGVEGSDGSKVVSDQEMMESVSPRNKDSLTVRRFCSC